MVVGHLYIESMAILEAEADSPLLVDEDRVLALSIATQGMQAIAGRDSEVIELLCKVNVFQSLLCASDDAGGKQRDCPLTNKSLECLSAKVLIMWSVMRHVTWVKWKRLGWTVSGVIDRGRRKLRDCVRPWRAPEAGRADGG